MARLHQINGFYQRIFPFIRRRTQFWTVQTIDKSLVEQRFQVRSHDFVRHFFDICPRQIARFGVVQIRAIARVRRMFHEKSFFTHAQFFVFFGVLGVNFAPPQWVSPQQIHIYHDRQSVTVGANTRQFSRFIGQRQTFCGHNFGRNKIGRTNHIGRIFARHNQAVDVNNRRFASRWVNQNVFVRQIRMRQTRRVHPPNGTADVEAHDKIFEPIAFFVRV